MNHPHPLTFSIALDGKTVENSPNSGLHNEILAVSAGLKPCGRFSANESKAILIRDLLQKQDMHVLFYYPTNNEWGYQYLSPSLSNQLVKDRIRVYYSRDPILLQDLISAQKEGDNDRIGQLLGYPKCCVEANDLYGHTKMNDFVRLARVSDKAHWSLNIYLKELQMNYGSPYYLISHFPCHLNCDKSKVIAAETLELIRKSCPKFADRLIQALHRQILLFDDTSLSINEKTGLCGGALQGIEWESQFMYASWIPLSERSRPEMEMLNKGNIIRETSEGIEIISSEDENYKYNFSYEQWKWVKFE